MELKSVIHDNKSKLWCGPTALATLTGQPTSVIHRVIRDVSGKRKVTGTRVNHLIIAGLRLGIGMTKYSVSGKPTLAQWLRKNQALYAHSPVVITLTHHYVTVMGRRFVDSHTREPVFLRKAPHRRARVECYLTVKPLDHPVAPVPVPVKKVDPYAKTRRKTAFLAAAHGITIEKESPYEYWVYPPNALEDMDAYEGQHLADGWGDVEERVKRYVADLKDSIFCI